MNSIVSGVQKLIEHYALSWVNTGDRVLDNTINVVIVSVIGCIFMFDYKGFFSGATKKIEDGKEDEKKETLQFPRDKTEILIEFQKDSSMYKSYTWIASEFPEFTMGIKRDIACIYSKSIYVDIVNMTMRKGPVDINFEYTYVLYQCKDNSFVFACPLTKGFCIKCLSFECFSEYRDYICSKYEDSLVRSVSVEGSPIVDCEGDQLGFVYNDRTFDTIVSRHKKTIIHYLQEFTKPNKKAFDLHNLGILFHGPPGTGKTSMIKAIANYTGRSVVIVDLKKVQTIEELTKLMQKTDKLYCFEELDLVPGVLSRGSQERKDAEAEDQNLREKETTILYARYSDLLKLPEQTAETMKEMQSIQKKLDKMKNRIGLDTLLNLLDGPIEQRGRLIIATTNHPERLDPALVRPNRFDIKLRLGEYNSDEVEEYLKMYYSHKKASEEDMEYIRSNKYPNDIHVPIHVSNVCRSCLSARDAVDKLKI